LAGNERIPLSLAYSGPRARIGAPTAARTHEITSRRALIAGEQRLLQRQTIGARAAPLAMAHAAVGFGGALDLAQRSAPIVAERRLQRIGAFASLGQNRAQHCRQ